jgi:hypothetical protein
VAILRTVATEADCRQAASALLGESLARVVYVGLTYQDPDSIRWDYGDWHWPEVGVQLTTLSGRSFYAIWDSHVTHFELTFAEGHIRDQWLPLQRSDLMGDRVWDVSGHPRWAPLMNSPIASYRIALGVPDDPPVSAPVAIRLATDSGVAWIVAAAPRDEHHAREDIRADDVWVGFDEVIVLFDDVRAGHLGLQATS